MRGIDYARAGDAALADIDAWEAELSAEARTPQDWTPEEQYRAAVARRVEFAERVHRTHKNQRLDLSSGWFRAILEDPHPDVVIRKSVQCGVSEMLIVRELAEASCGRNVIHVCPNYQLRNRFVALRVDRPLRFVPRYRELAKLAVGEGMNRAFKLFGDGALYYLGSNTPDQFIEAVGDTAIVDEIDRCDQENLTLLPDRLSAAGKLPAWLRVGNPTHADFGVSALYDESDRGEWQVRCGACSRWQRVDWFENVVDAQRDDEGSVVTFHVRDPKWTAEGGRPLRAVCRRCAKPMDHLARGRWVHGKHARRGYHISKLMTVQASLDALLAEFAPAVGDGARMARFVNNDLGLPYSPPGSAVTEEMLDAARREFGQASMAAGPCTMGVDVGGHLDIRVSDCPEPEVRRARWIGRAPVRVDEIVGRLKKYNVKCCVIDAQPETHFCREVLRALGKDGARSRGVWLCRFSAGDDAREPRKDSRERVLAADRTQAFDAATQRLRMARNWLPRNARDLCGGDFYPMMTAPKRVQQEDARGNVRYVWTKGYDHARLADVYDELAFRVGGRAVSPLRGPVSARMSGRERRARQAAARRGGER